MFARCSCEADFEARECSLRSQHLSCGSQGALNCVMQRIVLSFRSQRSSSSVAWTCAIGRSRKSLEILSASVRNPIGSRSSARGSFVTALRMKVCATDADAIRTTESASGPAASSRAAAQMKRASARQPFQPGCAASRGRIRWADTASSPKVNFMRYWPG